MEKLIVTVFFVLLSLWLKSMAINEHFVMLLYNTRRRGGDIKGDIKEPRPGGQGTQKASSAPCLERVGEIPASEETTIR